MMRFKPKFRPNLPAANSRTRGTASGTANAASILHPSSSTEPQVLGKTPDPALSDPPSSPPSPSSSMRCPSASAASSTPLFPPSPPPVSRTESLKEVFDEEADVSPKGAKGVTEKHRRRSGPATDAARPLSPSPLTGTSSQGIVALKRPRRLTEHSSSGVNVPPSLLPSSLYDKRKAEHKRRFHGGTPQRHKMTMFDLIYYNPSDGSRMAALPPSSPSAAASRASSRTSSVSERLLNDGDDAVVPDRLQAVAERLEEEAVEESGLEKSEGPAGSAERDSAESNVEDNTTDQSLLHASKEVEGEEETAAGSKLPVPKVKVGPNGEVILDEESTLIETTASKKGKEVLLRSPLVFEGSGHSGTTNYGSWGKKRKNVDWSEKETLRFYKALSVFGTDFSMMEGVFKKRSRHELKMKFKKEERAKRGLVDKCLREGMQFDTSIFESESEEDADEIAKKQQEEKAAKTRKRRSSNAKGRKIKSNRGYFSCSSDEEEGVSPKMARESIREPCAPRASTSKATANKSPMLSSLLKVSDPLAVGLEGVDPAYKKSATFPPGFLDANPGLAAAVPGTLLVIASPNKIQSEKNVSSSGINNA